jgi:hypothetical protein
MFIYCKPQYRLKLCHVQLDDLEVKEDCNQRTALVTAAQDTIALKEVVAISSMDAEVLLYIVQPALHHRLLSCQDITAQAEQSQQHLFNEFVRKAIIVVKGSSILVPQAILVPARDSLGLTFPLA